jgi:hypothetical protein
LITRAPDRIRPRAPRHDRPNASDAPRPRPAGPAGPWPTTNDELLAAHKPPPLPDAMAAAIDEILARAAADAGLSTPAA